MPVRFSGDYATICRGDYATELGRSRSSEATLRPRYVWHTRRLNMVKHRMASPFPTGFPPYLPPSATARSRRRERSAPTGHVGQQLRQLRQSANLAAAALARSAGVSRSMLSRIEGGLVSPSIETLRKLAVGLGVPLSRLFSEKPDHRSWCHVPAGNRLKVEIGDPMDAATSFWGIS